MTACNSSRDEIIRILWAIGLVAGSGGVLIGVVLGVFWASQLMSPTYCYYESGNITDEYTAKELFYIEIESDKRHGYVWLVDEPQGTGDQIKLRWCWVPQIENFRVRGAWRE